MKFFSKFRDFITRHLPPQPARDVIEIDIYGLTVKFSRRITIPVPHEVSVFIPRLELTNKVKEGDRTAESSMVLNSLTIVSSPLREISEKPAKTGKKIIKLPAEF